MFIQAVCFERRWRRLFAAQRDAAVAPLNDALTSQLADILVRTRFVSRTTSIDVATALKVGMHQFPAASKYFWLSRGRLSWTPLARPLASV